MYLSVEMEGQIKVVEMEEDVLRQTADGVLSDFGEDRVPKLVEAGSATPEVKYCYFFKFTL
jgi:hypothetical protein